MFAILLLTPNAEFLSEKHLKNISTSASSKHWWKCCTVSQTQISEIGMQSCLTLPENINILQLWADGNERMSTKS